MFNWFKKSETQSKSLGQIGEELAQAEYKAQGFSILDRNYFNRKGLRVGEIDFIAKNREKIVFVEVKTRTSEAGKFGSGAEAVDIYKQRKILKAVKTYLLKNPEYASLQPQIDVCVILMDPLDKTPTSVKILVNAVEDGS